MSNTDKLDNVYQIITGYNGGKEPPEPPMELTERVGNLETDMRDVRDRMTRIEVRLDTFSTKEDMHKEFNVQTWRLVTWTTGLGTALVASAYFIAKHVG